MSQTNKVHKLTIRNRPGSEGKISVGANVQVLLDGQPLKGCSFLKLEIKAARVAKVQLELYAEVDAELYSQLAESPKRKTGMQKAGGKHLAVYNLSNYGPSTIVKPDSEK